LQERWYHHEAEIASGINHFPLENYSMRYWPDHYKLCKKGSNLHKLVSTFVQDDNVWFKKWATLYQRFIFELGFTLFSALTCAAYVGLDDIVLGLVMQNTGTEEYNQALKHAALKGHLNTETLLLENQVGIDSMNVYTHALHNASLNGHVEIVKLLLDHRADVNAQGGEYGNALQAASDPGYHKSTG
jgi:hypothetical protein